MISLFACVEEKTGYWGTVASRALEFAREEAWKSVGISPTVSMWLSKCDLTPLSAKGLGYDLKKLIGVGYITIEKMYYMTKDHEEKWNRRFETAKPKCINWSSHMWDDQLEAGLIPKEKHEQAYSEATL